MAQLIIDIPDANIIDVRDTLSVLWGYQLTVANPLYHPNQFLDAPDNLILDPAYDPNQTIPNPQTKVAFLKAFVARWLKESYQYGKSKQAAIDATVLSKGVTDLVSIL